MSKSLRMAWTRCRFGSITVALSLCQLIIVPPDGKADSTNVAARESSSNSPSYCGIESLYAALSCLGIECSFDALVRPQYVSSTDGSSVEDLERAATFWGAHTIAAERLTVRDLLAIPTPVILHVTPEGRFGTFKHWVCYLGTENGYYRILDPGEPVQLVSAAELLSRWSGTGLIISKQPVSLLQLTWETRLSLLNYFLIPTAIWAFFSRRVGGVSLAFSRRVPRSITCQTARILVLSCVVAMLAQFCSPDSYWNNADVTRAIAAARNPDVLTQLSIDEFDRLARSEEVIVIDARMKSDYQAGHIKGAHNLPVNSGRVARQNVLRDAPKTSRVVVYCQSANCDYARVVAVLLISDGYSDVSVVDGGWLEWNEWKSNTS